MPDRDPGGRGHRGGGQRRGGGRRPGGKPGHDDAPQREGARRPEPRDGDGPSRRGDPSRRVVGGLHPVREVLRAGQPLRRLLVASGRQHGEVVDDILAAARAAGVEVVEVERDELDRLTDGLVHQGVVAIAPPFPYVALDAVLARAADLGEAPLLVALDGITDPHNLGSIARTAEAVGAHGLLVPQRRATGVTAAAEKSAAGALAHLPVAAVTNLVRTLEELREAGVWSIGLDGEASDDLADHPLVGEACVLVVGAEGKGLARLVRERCDALVRLPMRGRVGSLNASVAAGVALYTLLRARATSRD